MKEKKIICIVQARMSSTRLPGKVLKPILEKQTCIELLLKRLSLSKTIDNIIVATSDQKSDEPLAEELNKLGFYFSKKDNLIISIKYVLKNLENYSQTRDVVQKYYNWKITIF
mgnify:CR=1 FL=1